jgi:hypothetical protein
MSVLQVEPGTVARTISLAAFIHPSSSYTTACAAALLLSVVFRTLVSNTRLQSILGRIAPISGNVVLPSLLLSQPFLQVSILCPGAMHLGAGGLVFDFLGRQ